MEQVITVDNGSTDGTADAARDAGAAVVTEPRRGYGYASAAGVVAALGYDALVFMDGDQSFLPGEIAGLLAPLREDRADLVLGSRKLGCTLPGGDAIPSAVRQLAGGEDVENALRLACNRPRPLSRRQV